MVIVLRATRYNYTLLYVLFICTRQQRLGSRGIVVSSSKDVASYQVRWIRHCWWFCCSEAPSCHDVASSPLLQKCTRRSIASVWCHGMCVANDKVVASPTQGCGVAHTRLWRRPHKVTKVISFYKLVLHIIKCYVTIMQLSYFLPVINVDLT